ncbi:MAG: PKD domain-containing protein [Chloroflexi bacterium]|nr:PKD domain-containing protein [Chloroflexota bacterium]
MRRLFTKKWLPVLAVLAIVGAACGGGGGDGEASTEVPSTPTSIPAAGSENRSPTADFIWHPDAVPEGDNYQTMFTFSASASDPDGDPLTYEWQFTGGRPPTATGELVNTTFPGIAPYLITLTVSDGRGGETVVVHTVPLTAGALMPTSQPVPPTPEIDVDAKYRWEFFDIDQGAKPALALNSRGEPGIAYILEEIRGLINYAAWNGEGFDLSTIDEGYFYAPLDLAFGPDDRPYVTWHDHQDPDGFVPELGDATLGFLTDDGWQVEAAFSDGHDGWDNSVAVDAQGNAHMVAVDPYQFLSESGIEYYFFDGESWTVEEIGSGPISYEWGTGLVLDASGAPHLTYHDDEVADLFYAFKGPEGWVINTVDSEGDAGKFASLVLDSNEMPVISYLELTGPDGGISSGNVKLARATSIVNGTPEWEIQEIGSLPDIFMGFRGARLITSLALDSDDNPIVVYSDQSTIKLSHFDGEEWSTETVTTRGELPFGQLVSLDIDADGVLHLAFTVIERRDSPGVLGTVTYARGTPSE